MGPTQRIAADLSTLEKALGKGDLAAQKAPLEGIVRSLRSMRLKRLEDLELATRGKLITTLMRVQRQPRPPPSPVGAEGAAAGAPGELGAAEVTGAPPEAASVQSPPGTGGNVPGETTGISEGSPGITREMAQAEHPSVPGAGGASGEDVALEHAPGPQAGETTGISEGSPSLTLQQRPAVDEKTAAYQDVMSLVGQAWRAAGDAERAEVAFSMSGRPPPPEQPLPEPSAQPAEERRERRERPPREGREGRPAREGREARGAREERAPRAERPPREAREKRERPERAPRAPAAPAPVLTEGQQALQAALDAKDMESARKLAAQLKAEEARPLLEKVQAWDLLMELYMRAGDFDSVARLYERARQFDQAALAWERAGKLTPARKAYERVRDFAAANRVRKLEVDRLVQKGDRLGAATLLMSAGMRKEAAEVIGGLPAPKAYHFLKRVKLDEEAAQLAQRELARADAEGKPLQRARWLETTGELQAAADAFEAAGRKDRASVLQEQLGNPARAAELAEASGQRERALALYEKLGDTAGAERVRAMPPTPQPTRSPEGEQAEGAEGPSEQESESIQ